MHVRHAHAGVKLIVQAELCVGKTASIAQAERLQHTSTLPAGALSALVTGALECHFSAAPSTLRDG